MIGKNLSSVGNVIHAIREKAAGKTKFVPYRDSNVTRVLQNALGGNCHTYLLCTITPGINSYDETLSTLRFGDRARKIFNNPIINEKSVEE